jgi:hypothetical protein
MRQQPDARITRAPQRLVGHDERTAVVVAHGLDEGHVERAALQPLQRLQLGFVEHARHGGPLSRGAHDVSQCAEPALPPVGQVLVLAARGRHHEPCQRPQPRLLGLRCRQSRQRHALLVMRRHGGSQPRLGHRTRARARRTDDRSKAPAGAAPTA